MAAHAPQAAVQLYGTDPAAKACTVGGLGWMQPSTLGTALLRWDDLPLAKAVLADHVASGASPDILFIPQHWEAVERGLGGVVRVSTTRLESLPLG